MDRTTVSITPSESGGALSGAAHGGRALSPEEFAEIKSLITAVLAIEPDVQKQPPPRFTYQNDATGLLSVTINYAYAPTGVPQTLSFNVPAYSS